MPGILGVIPARPRQDVQGRFERLLKPMRRGGRLREETQVASNGQWALGRVHLGVLCPEAQSSNNGDVHVVFHGDLDNEQALRELLEQEGCTPQAGVSALIRGMYRQWGSACISRLRGAFCAVILDESKRTLFLINDYLGSYPLYWHVNTDGLLFASELKSLLSDDSIQAALNPKAVADYLTFGFLLGDKTLDSSVRLLPQGSYLAYQWEDRSCRIEPYVRLDSFFHPWAGSRDEYYEALRPLFNAAVSRALNIDKRIGLALSGGLDSRAILSATAGRSAPLYTYTLGVKGCADEVIAEKLARLGETRHVFAEMDPGYLKDFVFHLQRMVHLTDGMYLTHGLTEILALRMIEQGGYEVLLRGHGAELAKVSLAWPLHTDAKIYSMNKKEEFIPYMLARANYISPSAPLGDLFMPEWWDGVNGGARQSLETTLGPVDLQPADLCSYLYLAEHHRRFTIPSLELFRNFAEVRLPFVDIEFLKVLWSGPSTWRDSTAIHQAIIGRNNLAMLKVRNSNTGAPGDAGPFVEAVCDKFNSLFKRMNLHGYRHYHTFENWMRDTLINSVEEIMLDPQTLKRGLYQEDTLRNMIAETRSGHADYSYLFQILLILELWQREWT